MIVIINLESFHYMTFNNKNGKVMNELRNILHVPDKQSFHSSNRCISNLINKANVGKKNVSSVKNQELDEHNQCKKREGKANKPMKLLEELEIKKKFIKIRKSQNTAPKQ